ncbi:unnamed protein product [Pleuronectes platessa]|uniref:Uncharacterized protein n=1 Tax=Pleuronectes platessa TaxID=8262 RepID=A0A9N7UHI6_PLEPL|nr:unnamed protein product [Pleuronectes platessa]
MNPGGRMPLPRKRGSSSGGRPRRVRPISRGPPTSEGGEQAWGDPLVGSTSQYTGMLITSLWGLSCRASTVRLWSSLRQAAAEPRAPGGSGASVPRGSFETDCQAVVCAGSIQRVHPKIGTPSSVALEWMCGTAPLIKPSFTMDNSEASLRAPATPCSINLACNSPDESPTGVRGDWEVKTPPVPTKSRSGRQEVLEIQCLA